MSLSNIKLFRWIGLDQLRIFRFVQFSSSNLMTFKKGNTVHLLVIFSNDYSWTTCFRETRELASLAAWVGSFSFAGQPRVHNLLKDTDNKTASRKCHLFTTVLFSVAHFFQKTKWCQIAIFYLYFLPKKTLSEWKIYMANIFSKKWLLFHVKII